MLVNVFVNVLVETLNSTVCRASTMTEDELTPGSKRQRLTGHVGQSFL